MKMKKEISQISEGGLRMCFVYVRTYIVCGKVQAGIYASTLLKADRFRAFNEHCALKKVFDKGDQG